MHLQVGFNGIKWWKFSFTDCLVNRYKWYVGIYFIFFIISAVILPVVQKQHQLLVTLLLCNACAMEVSNFLQFPPILNCRLSLFQDLKCFFQALPIYLDKIFHPFVAVVLSVTFVLAFGEVGFSPLSIVNTFLCSRTNFFPL